MAQPITPARRGLSPDLRDLLRKNGMRASLAQQGNQPLLIVRGHDSPTIGYPIPPSTADMLSRPGRGPALAQAYDTFNAITGRNFYHPYSYQEAASALGRTIVDPRRTVEAWQARPSLYARYMMADPTYRIATELSRQERHEQRKADFRAERFGYYDKNNVMRQQDATDSPFIIDVSEEELMSLLEGTKVDPIVQNVPSPSSNNVIPLNRLVPEEAVFSNDRWLEALSSHGIIIDADKKTLEMQSTGSQYDVIFDLSDEEYGLLTNPSLKEASLSQRLDAINALTESTFVGDITLEHLNSDKKIDLQLQPAELARIGREEKPKAESQSRGSSQTAFTGATEGAIANSVYIQRLEPIELQATPLKQLVANDADFTGDKWLEALSSHGVDINPDWGSMVISPVNSDKQFQFSLSAPDGTFNKTDSLEEASIEDRLYVINDAIKNVFADKITLEHLNSDKHIDLRLQPAVAAELERRATGQVSTASKDQSLFVMIDRQGGAQAQAMDAPGVQSVHIERQERRETKSKYTLTVNIDGQEYTGEISQNKFNNLKLGSDYHKLKVIDNVIKDLDVGNLDHATTVSLLDQLHAAISGEAQDAQKETAYKPELYAERKEETLTTGSTQKTIANLQALASENFERLMSESESQSQTRGYKA